VLFILASFLLRVKEIIIFGTSFLGAYLFIRGIAMLAGGYPNEVDAYNAIIGGKSFDVGGTFYPYFASMVVVTVLGVAIQT